MEDADRFIEGVLKASDPANKWEYEQVQTATWGHLQPERRLLMALLEDCFLTLRGRRVPGLANRNQRAARYEALAWVERGDTGAFSLIDTCAHLGFSVRAVRKEARKAYEVGKKPGEYFNRVTR